MSVQAAPAHRLPREGESMWKRAQRADYVIDDGGCWLWQKNTLDGYGLCGDGRAHRVYYERAKGQIPEGHEIHHLCRNTLCVNPTHLEPLDSRAHKLEHLLTEKGRSFSTVLQVRAERAEGATFRAIAARHGLSYSTVRRWCGNGLEPSWQDFVGDRVEVPMGTCRLAECGETFPILTGPGVIKRYCCPAHRSKHNHRRYRDARQAPPTNQEKP